jgi:hypothetical protein
VINRKNLVFDVHRIVVSDAADLVSLPGQRGGVVLQ